MNTPEKGFYYHYKHDPALSLNNYAYEVLGIASHTEIKDFEKSFMVVYRPLYDSKVYREGKIWDVRPRDMFLENVEKMGGIPRFTKITDPKAIEELERIKLEMYES